MRVGRSGYIQWMNTWCMAGVAARSLSSVPMKTLWRSKDFKAGTEPSDEAWQVSLPGFKPSEEDFKLSELKNANHNF